MPRNTARWWSLALLAISASGCALFLNFEESYELALGADAGEDAPIDTGVDGGPGWTPIMAPIVLARQQQSPTLIALEGSRIAWTNETEGAGSVRLIQRDMDGGTDADANIPPPGDPSVQLLLQNPAGTAPQSFGALALSGDAFIIGGAGSGYKCFVQRVFLNSDGSKRDSHCLMSGQNQGTGVAGALGESYAYVALFYVGPTTVHRVLRDRTGVELPLAPPLFETQSKITALTAGLNETLYFAEGDAIRTVQAGADAGALDLAKGQSDVVAIIYREGQLIWATRAGQISTLILSDAGSGTATVVADDPNGITALASDGRRIAFTNATRGTVKMVPIVGGPLALVADKQGSPQTIAIAADGIYWVNKDDGVVVMLPNAGLPPTQ